MSALRRFSTIASPVLLCAALAGACSRTSSHERRETPEPPARVPWGTAMAEVARRFEALGRAAAAGRYELADYELGELGETFEDVLPHAAPPREGHPEVLPALAAAFTRTNLPDLQRAVTARDRSAIASAFARTATACNGCHAASGHGFIEVPSAEGKSIPSMDPVAQ